MASKKLLELANSLSGNRLSEGSNTPKNKRTRRSRLDDHIEFIHQFISSKTQSARPHTYTLRKLARAISRRDGKSIWHTTVMRYLESKGLMEIFNA